jgi:magnesium transporter
MRVCGKQRRIVGTALLFEKDQVGELDEWRTQVGRLGRSSILWIDLAERPDEDEIGELSASLGLTTASERRLAERTADEPQASDFGSYLHVSAFAPAHDGHDSELVCVECLVSDRWVVTVHNRPVSVIDEFRASSTDGGETGRLDGLEFLASLLEWVLNGYLRAFEDFERELEEFDTRAMEGNHGDTDQELRRLVGLRRSVGSLRRAVVSHREVFLALTSPELELVAGSDSVERFRYLRSRLEDVVQTARDTRESLTGSFDILVARTEHRTNEIVKVLTLVTVLLLPAGVIAGILGMNFKLGLFENDWYFAAALALMTGVAGITLLAARLRSWI